MKTKNQLYSNLYYKHLPNKIYSLITSESELMQAYVYCHAPFWFKQYYLLKKKFTKEDKTKFLEKVDLAKDNEHLSEIIYDYFLKAL